MKVSLIAHTPEPERTCAVAALQCYSHRSATEIAGEITEKKMKEVLSFIMRSGHLSVIEHANFTFSIEDVSRVTTHQLVRHRIASYSQQSQRYVPLDTATYVVPPAVKENGLENLFKEVVEGAWDAYSKLVESGVPREDARYLLPGATTSRIIITMNARSLWNFFTLRTCRRAQWEIREMATEMLRKVKKVSPTLFSGAGPACLRGPCPEGEKTCGKPYTSFPP